MAKKRRVSGKRKARTPAQYFSQPAQRRESQLKAAHVLTAMRTEKLSLHRASRLEGVSPATVRRYAGSALRKTAKGKYQARKTDRMLRVLLLPTPIGLAEIATADSRTATIVAGYWNAVNYFLETGDRSQLAAYDGVTINDAQGRVVTLLTDPAELERLGSAGILSFQSLYARAS